MIPPVNFGSIRPVNLKNINLAAEKQESKKDAPKMESLPSHMPRPPFLGNIVNFEAAERISKSHQRDIESLFEQKVAKSEIIEYTASGKPKVEKITLENDTVLLKRTTYDDNNDGKLDNFALSYKTNTPDDYPNLRFEYSEEFVPMEGFCFVRYFNKNNEQAHGVYLETELK